MLQIITFFCCLAPRDYLSSMKQDGWVASFEAIEGVLGFRLPQSARKYPAWWANESTSGHKKFPRKREIRANLWRLTL
jgi:hypothetical protein